MNIIHDFERTILQYDMFKKGDSVLVALSGGPDSVALLYFLVNLLPQYKLNLYIAHLNHGLRGGEALKDEKFCVGLGKKLNILVFTDKVDIKQLKKKESGGSTEEIARCERYKFLGKIAKRVGVSKIVLGHTADDQTETVLMRLIRGAGTKGLSGIPPKRKLPSGIWIVRPLINVWKKEILVFLKNNRIRFVEDSTNKKLDFMRNRVRHELVPFLTKYNPKIKSIIQSTGSNLGLIDDYIKGVVKEEFKRSTNLCKEGISISCNKFNNYHPAIRQLLVCRIAKEINPLVTLEADNVRKVISLALRNNGTKVIHLPRGMWVRREYSKLIFSNTKRTINKEYCRKLIVGGKTEVSNHKILVTSMIDKVNGGRKRLNKKKIDGLSEIFRKKGLSFEAKIDYDTLNKSIIIRSRRPGDRFRPTGTGASGGPGGIRKVKDIFIDAKVPKIYRDKIPIIASGKDICWIVGYRIGEKFKVTPKTKRILHLKVAIN